MANQSKETRMHSDSDCFICSHPIDGVERLYSFGCCNHKLCSLCFFRMRYLQDNCQCPVCNTSLDRVISSNNKHAEWPKLELWGDDIGGDNVYHEKSRMYFPRGYLQDVISNLTKIKCQECQATFRHINVLKNHMTEKHTHQYCTLCLDHRHLFPSEFRLYTKAQLEQHLRKGDNDGSIGHPLCEFCKRRFFDRDSLFLHLRE